MAIIARLRDAQISAGNTILADDVETELNQLVNEHNSKEARLANLETNAMTIAGVKTFTSNPKVSGIDPITPSVGVTVAGMAVIGNVPNPSVSADPSTPVNGMLWYNTTSNQLKAHINSTTAVIATAGATAPYPARYQASTAPVYASATTCTLATLACRDSTNTTDITKATSTTLTLTASGLNGLDTGSRAANTWYYVYAIAQAAGASPGVICSTVNEAISGSITLPSGYTVKRQLPFAFRTDASSNMLAWRVGEGWPHRPVIWYDTILDDDTAASTTRILASGNATSYTAVSAAAYVPPISQLAFFKPTNAVNTGAYIRLRPTGGGGYVQLYGWVQRYTDIVPCGTNSSQSIDYLVSASSYHVAVAGFVVTEV